MDVRITQKKLSGELNAISSKSHAHRILIAAALSGEPADVIVSETSDDIEATRECLKQFDKDEPVFDCRESGSTLRFLLPLAMINKSKATFTCSGSLPGRPLSPLKEQLEEHGCDFSNSHDNNYVVEGKLRGGQFTVAGGVSSQFISGLLFALPLLNVNSEILITSSLQSADYVTMTLKVLEQFGVRVEVLYDPDSVDEAYSAFRIRGNQKYVSPGCITIEGDWSSAAFWLAAGAISPYPDAQITCRGLNLFSFQGDRKITAIIKAFGGSISRSNIDVTSSPGVLRGIEIDAANIPDLIPVISVIASVSFGTTRIINAERLRIKESDRLHALYDCLTKLGADVEEREDSLIIKGKEKLKGGTVSSYNDHRIAMAMAIAALRCEEPVIIQDAGAINKSYPNFFDDFKKLGGDVVIL